MTKDTDICLIERERYIDDYVFHCIGYCLKNLLRSCLVNRFSIQRLNIFSYGFLKCFFPIKLVAPVAHEIGLRKDFAVGAAAAQAVEKFGPVEQPVQCKFRSLRRRPSSRYL